MSTRYSDQAILKTVPGNQYSEGNRDTNAKVRIDYFSVAASAAVPIAAADQIILTTLPKGARILDGMLIGPANTAAATLALGTNKDLVGGSNDGTTIPAGTANLLAASAISAAYATPFAASFATGGGFKTTAVTDLVATLAGAALTAGTPVTGWIKYTVN